MAGTCWIAMKGPGTRLRPVLSVFVGTVGSRPTADESWSMDGDEVVMVE